MTEVVGKHLANFIGEFVDYDPQNNSSIWRAYMRIKVRLDVRKPLKKDRKVRIARGEWCLVKFRYEKLSIFCFVCDCIGHTEQSCEVLFVLESDDGVRGWSAELRAEQRRMGAAGGSRFLKEERGGQTEPRVVAHGGAGLNSNLGGASFQETAAHHIPVMHANRNIGSYDKGKSTVGGSRSERVITDLMEIHYDSHHVEENSNNIPPKSMMGFIPQNHDEQ